MSSKRAKRAKRKEALKNYDPNYVEVKNVKVKPKQEPVYVKELPGQMWTRTGGVLLFIGGLLSAGMVFSTMNTIRGMSSQEVIQMAEASGASPAYYFFGMILMSIGGVLEFTVGFDIYKNARNPFRYRRNLYMAVIVLLYQLLVNVVTMLQMANGIHIMMLLYGCTIPMLIIYGSLRNKKFALTHPNYIPPAPTEMF